MSEAGDYVVAAAKRRRYPVGLPRQILTENWKFLDLEFASAMAGQYVLTNYDPTGDCLNPVPQGDGASARTGRSYVITRVQVRGFLITVFDDVTGGAVTTQPSERQFRVMLVLDRHANGAQLTPTLVLPTTSTTYEFNALQVPSYMSRVSILGDKRCFAACTAAALLDQATLRVMIAARYQEFEFDVVFEPPLRVTHNGATGSVSTIVDNALHFLAIADESTDRLEYYSRVTFLDDASL